MAAREDRGKRSKEGEDQLRGQWTNRSHRAPPRGQSGKCIWTARGRGGLGGRGLGGAEPSTHLLLAGKGGQAAIAEPSGQGNLAGDPKIELVPGYKGQG